MHCEAGPVERLQGVEHRVSAGDLNSGTPSESGGLGGGGRKKLAAHLRKGSGVRRSPVLAKPVSHSSKSLFLRLFLLQIPGRVTDWGNNFAPKQRFWPHRGQSGVVGEYG